MLITNTLLFNAGGILAWYPTKLKYHRINPYMHGDLLGDVVAAAHETGVRVVGRCDFSKCPQPALDERPDWFYLSPSGGRVDYNGQYHTCICGGYYAEENFGLGTEKNSSAVPRFKKYHGTSTFHTEALTIEATRQTCNGSV